MVFTITKVSDNLDITIDKEKCWRQFLFTIFASLPFFTHGVESIVLSSSAHSGHFITAADQIWNTTAIVIGAGLAAPIFCCIIDRFGRRCGIYIVSLVQGASCIPLFLPPTEPAMLVLHTLAGLSTGGLFTVLPIYIREISYSNRGLHLSLMMMMTSAGYLMNLIIDDEEMMYVIVGMVVVQLMMILVLVESPSWLVMNKKMKIAKANIAKLKCLADDSPNVDRELEILQNEMDRVQGNGKVNIITLLKNPLSRDFTKIGIVLGTIMMICGSIIFLDQEKTLAQIKLPIDPQKTMTVSCLFAGSILTVAVIKFIDRRYIITSGFAIMVLSMGILGVYTQELNVNTLQWVPISALGVLVVGYGMIWGLGIVILVEMLNFRIRATLLGAIYAYSQIVKLAHIHSIQYVENYLGLYTLFYIFAGINMYGGVYSLFAIPSIKGKNVRQIERQMKRVPILKFSK